MDFTLQRSQMYEIISYRDVNCLKLLKDAFFILLSAEVGREFILQEKCVYSHSLLTIKKKMGMKSDGMRLRVLQSLILIR